ncbi:MAG TPA: glutamate--tRNA ligase [Planctomycetota bacterium]|nr:glutamate--tRNA ligase [Planctomycetota bacterium]
MPDKPRVRFAPSPTGYLHIGGARTALYNWLYARHTGGTFILRIEDTDRERHTPEAVQAIIDGMKWLGMDWDEGPIHQSDRLARYQEVAAELEKKGLAYKTTKGAEDKGEALAFRVAAAKEKVAFDDQVLGKVEFQDEVIEDFILMRSNGWPTYNFSCVIDDHDMAITDVIRGLDHVSNTPRQIMIYKAMGWTSPRFAHIPMITNSEGKKYSKRDGAVAVGDYANAGYLPEAFANYTALLGWSPGGDVEIMSRQEMVEKFTVDRVRKTASQFDFQKLEWMNGKYIEGLPAAELAERMAPFFKSAGLDPDARGREWLEKLGQLLKERAHTLVQFPKLTRYFFADDYEVVPQAAELLAKDTTPAALKAALAALEKLPEADWTPAKLDPLLREAAKAAGMGFGKLAQPVRAAVTGTNVSPGLFEVLELLGREVTLARIRRAPGVG